MWVVRQGHGHQRLNRSRLKNYAMDKLESIVWHYLEGKLGASQAIAVV